MDEIIQNIFSLIRTTSEREEVRAGIQELSKSLYKSFPETFHSVLNEKFRARIGDMLREWFDKQSYLRNPGLITADIEKLDRAILSMRVLRIEVALEPNASFVDRIASWAHANLPNDFVLDIARDSAIVGGARLVYKGRYKEYTLSEMIKSVFEKKRDIVLRELQ
ncbi:MAG: hypothetical protein A2847_02275 [Candidatus Sungbacteria bacterium RIFCSPHIGHO2_01_FULL_50_25]|uniref:ATP synthase subunit delta n=1 Tax=Candidatus Sungbacteria bacterium RIFCSPHIGHO2_01_FULL_50_25 TaxID=1802265 RepID=A0A1G2KAI0_9BACT|nr:MAG: hypothetical protein A2847_02275 [Candidatus Sungbacteria bacterium RIFCSPHIGHO2_01_FULL_50_25]